MKEIFKLIFLILSQVIRVSFYSKALHNNLAELGKLIDELPNDYEALKDKLAPEEKDYLKGENP